MGELSLHIFPWVFGFPQANWRSSTNFDEINADFILRSRDRNVGSSSPRNDREREMYLHQPFHTNWQESGHNFGIVRAHPSTDLVG